MIRRVSIMLLGLFALAVTACGVPKSSGFSAIDPSRLPPGLTESTTTTSTTLPEATSTSAVDPPTTTTPIEQVTLYFVVGNNLQGNYEQLAGPVDFGQILEVLRRGPSSLAGTQGFRTAIPPDAVFSTSKARGTVTVDLNPTFFDGVPVADQPFAIGQMVLTLTERNGVGAVKFTQNGEPVSVLLPDGQPSTPGQELFQEDYESMLASSPPPTTTTTTTTTTSPPVTEPPPTA